MSRVIKQAAVLALATVLTGCATSPTGRSQFMLISPEAAIVESETAYLSTVGELDREGKLVTDPELVGRIARITGRLVTVAEQTFPGSRETSQTCLVSHYDLDIRTGGLGTWVPLRCALQVSIVITIVIVITRLRSLLTAYICVCVSPNCTYKSPNWL